MKPAGFRLEASGTIWSKRYATYQAAAKALARLQSRGYSGAVNNLGGRWVVRLRVDSFMENPPKRGRKVTKAQKNSKASKRVSRALTKYVRNFTGTITRTQDGQVVIAGTGPKPKTAKNPLLPQGGLKRVAAEYKRHRAAGEGVGRSVKRAVRTARSNKKRKR